MSEPFRVAGGGGSTEALSGGDSSPQKGSSSATSSTEPGLYTYSAVKGRPMAQDYFKLTDFVESGHYEDLSEQMQAVDAWIQEKARTSGLKDSKESYEEILKELYKQIGKSDNEDSFSRFKRVNAAVQAMQRLKEAKLPPVLDSNELKSEEIKAMVA